jgi:hypothetical protein
MSGAYVRAVQDALGGFVSLLVKLALPLSILFGLAIVSASIAYLMRKDEASDSLIAIQRACARLAGFCLMGLVFVVCWAALSQARAVATDAFEWQDAAEEVANPTEDAPPVTQYGPAVAILKESIFTRTIALPFDIGKRIEEEGVQLLSQYLPESGSTDVLDQSEKLEKKGNGFFLTRQVKRMEEAPIPFQKSSVSARFDSLGSRAYSVAFKGSYAFKNPEAEPRVVRFTFAPPEAGTVGDMQLSVDGRTLELDDQGNYSWSGTMQPNEAKTATVGYKVVGSKTWSYDVGSRRRRVEDFHLSVQSPLPLKYVRGSIQPTASGQNPEWKLADVVTNQRVALSFPSDRIGRETYLQTIAMLPAAMALFAFGLLVVGWRAGATVEPIRNAIAIVLFSFGLAGASVLANYLGSIAGVFVSFGLGIFGAFGIAGGRSLMASVPAAFFAAAFLSAEHTGLIIVLLALASLASYAFLLPKEQK